METKVRLRDFLESFGLSKIFKLKTYLYYWFLFKETYPSSLLELTRRCKYWRLEIKTGTK